jgi:hypothetical protein
MRANVQRGEHAAEVLKRPLLSVEKGLLRGTRIRPMEPGTAGQDAHAEHLLDRSYGESGRCCPDVWSANITSGLPGRWPGTNSIRSGNGWATILVPCRDAVLPCPPRSAVYSVTSARSSCWVSRRARAWRRRTCTCASNWRSSRSVTRSRGGPTQPRESRSSCWPGCSTGARSSPWSNRTR